MKKKIIRKQACHSNVVRCVSCVSYALDPVDNVAGTAYIDSDEDDIHHLAITRRVGGLGYQAEIAAVLKGTTTVYQ